MLEATGRMVNTVGDFLVECLELTIRQGDRDGQEDELFARLLAPWCFSGGRCCRQQMRVHKLSPDIAGVYTSGKMILTSVLAIKASSSVARLKRQAMLA